MITKYSHTPVWVLDQDSAKKFYTEKLGFEVRSDMSMDGLRWLTVGPKGQPDFELILANPGPPMVDDEAAKAIRGLVARRPRCRRDGDRGLPEDTRRAPAIEACSSSRSRPIGRMGLRRYSATTQGIGSA